MTFANIHVTIRKRRLKAWKKNYYIRFEETHNSVVMLEADLMPKINLLKQFSECEPYQYHAGRPRNVKTDFLSRFIA